MDSADQVNRIRPQERIEGAATSGMIREEAISVEGLWAGLVRTDAHMTSGWHHHGDYETSIYVINGALRMESGPEGGRVVEGRPGDFLHVPKGAIHRESNPMDTESQLVVVRAGHGPAVFNVDGPASAVP
ncbi:MAG TPA: cupin domain-containing protein [Acidimicrobiia bacterium]